MPRIQKELVNDDSLNRKIKGGQEDYLTFRF